MDVLHLKAFRKLPQYDEFIEVYNAGNRWLFATNGYRAVGLKTFESSLDVRISSTKATSIVGYFSNRTYSKLNTQHFMAWLFNEDEACDVCSGTHKIECEDCNGDGECECEECNGSGQISEDCEECDGDGKKSEDCEECDGSGKTGDECDVCEGSGKNKQDCDECSCTGKREVDCDECDGSGEEDSDEEDHTKSTPCSNCTKGKVEEDCPYCEEGYIENDCEECDEGRIEHDCEHCDDGKVENDCEECDCGQIENDCKDCEGTGQVECNECDENQEQGCKLCSSEDRGKIFENVINLELIKDLSMDYFDEISIDPHSKTEPIIFRGEGLMAVIMPMRIREEEKFRVYKPKA